HRTKRRRASVRRGGRAAASRARRTGRPRRDPAGASVIAGGAARPTGRGAEDRRNWRGSRARVRLFAAARRGGSAGGGAPGFARAPERSGHRRRQRRFAGQRLSLQTRVDPGRGLREPTQEPPTGAVSARGRTVASPYASDQEPDAIARHIAAAERRGRNWRKTPRIGRARALPADGTDCLWLKSYK